MTKLVDKIERLMWKSSPCMFGTFDYYHEARTMVQLLRMWPHGYSIRALCEETFQIWVYRPGYDYDVNQWETLVAEITWLLEKLMAEKRMKKIRNQLLTAVTMKTIRGELIATAMSPERVGSIVERYGESAPCETFA